MKTLSKNLILLVGWVAATSLLQATDAPSATTPASTAATTAASASVTTAVKAKKKTDTLTTIVVTAASAPLTEEQAIQSEHDSNTQEHLLSEQKIQESGSITVAQAAKLLPGVSTQYWAGEPISINIRGVNQNFNETTYNGFELPTNSYTGTSVNLTVVGSGRGVSLNSLPASLISGLDLTEVSRPDQTGQGLGGQVDLVPDSAFNYVTVQEPSTPSTSLTDSKDVKTVASAGTAGVSEVDSYKSQHAEVDVNGGGNSTYGTPSTTTSARWSDIFQLSNDMLLGVFLSGGIDYHSETYDTFGPTLNLTNANTAGESINQASPFSGFSITRYTGDHTRGGIGGNIELHIANDTHVSLNGYYSGEDDVIAKNTIGYNVFSTPLFSNYFYEIQYHNAGIFLNADHTFDNGIVVDSAVGFANGSYHQPYFITDGFSYTGTTPSGEVAYQQGGRDNNSVALQVPAADLNVSNYKLAYIGNDGQDDQQQNLYWRGDIKIPVSVADTDGVLKTGYDFRSTDRRNAINYWLFDYPTAATAASDAQQLLSPSGAYQAVNGKYPIPFHTTLNQINGFQNGNPLVDQVPAYPLYFAGLGGESYYNVNENALAGYLQYTTHVDKFTLIGGVRLEGTLEYWEDYSNPQLVTTPLYKSTTTASATTLFSAQAQELSPHNKDYVNVLPSVQLKYDILPTLDARASYTETMARPDFQAFAGAVYFDGSSTYTYGNPKLVATRSHNFDTSINWYPNPDTKLTLALFDKEINDYTYGHKVIDVADTTPTKTFYNAYWNQIPNAEIYGIEADYEQQFTFLPGVLSGLGVDGNVVLNSSSGTDHPIGNSAPTALPGECPLTWNLGTFYRTSKWTFNIDCAYTAPYVLSYGVGVTPTTDVYQDEFYSLNAKLQYAINQNFKVYVEGMNLANQPFREYEGNKADLYNVEVDGPTFDGGLTFTF